MWKKMFFIFFIISLIAIGFAENVKPTKSYNSLYDVCINSYSGQQQQNCLDIYKNATMISDSLNIAYFKSIDNMIFINCVKKKINNNEINLNKIRDDCYTSIMQKNIYTKTFNSFKTNCSYDINKINNKLNVECKYILPSICFKPDISLENDTNNYLILPIISKPSNNCVNFARIMLIKKQFDIDNNKPIKIESPIFKGSKNKTISFDDFFKQTNIFNKTLKMSDIEKSYYKCITNFYLTNKFDDKGIINPTSIYNYSNKDIIKICGRKINYNYKINYFTTLNELEKIRLNMKKEFEDFLKTISLENMRDFINNIKLDEEKYYKLSNIVDNKKGEINYSASTEEYIARFKKAVKDLNGESRKELINDFKNTLFKNLEAEIQWKEKNNINEIMSFFDNLIKDENSEDIKNIFHNIEIELLNKKLDTINYINLTDFNMELSTNAIKTNNLVLGFIKPVIIKDNNVEYKILNKKDYLVINKDKNYLFETSETIQIKTEELYINNKKIVFPKFKNENGKVKNMKLIINEDGVPVFITSFETKGRFLGLFNVYETRVFKNNALNGILFDVVKPWWDFLFVR